MTDPFAYRSFPSTHWSLVNLVAHTDDTVRRDALASWFRRYLPALRTYLVAVRHVQPNEADDILQSFVVSKVLEDGLIARARSDRGRFRTFLLTALNHFIISQHRADQAHKRRVSQAGSLEAVPEPPAGTPDPAHAFDLAWARQVLAEAIARFREDCASTHRPELWGLFKHRVLAEAMPGAKPLDYAALVERYHLQSPTQASNLLITAKRGFTRALRAVIAEYARDDAEIDVELQDLHRLLAAPHAPDSSIEP